MRGRVRFSFIRYLFVLAVLGIAGCAGTPSDFNTVVLRVSARTIVAGAKVTITASVPKDTMNEGVTWVLCVAGRGQAACARDSRMSTFCSMLPVGYRGQNRSTRFWKRWSR